VIGVSLSMIKMHESHDIYTSEAGVVENVTVDEIEIARVEFKLLVKL